ncbi:MAG: AtpZ/AtpI family protein [Candidatus Magnetoovum sp. WYHC-5]|nr:AtpZ/AtpI family protein [Candidatus Magnetoovum sp. WYHC-5]
MKNDDQKGIIKHLTLVFNVGVNLVVSTIVGFYIGKVLDGFLNTSPYLTILFIIAGILAGFREIFRIAKKHITEDD